MTSPEQAPRQNVVFAVANQLLAAINAGERDLDNRLWDGEPRPLTEAAGNLEDAVREFLTRYRERDHAH
jgi:hypothetical protein